MEKEIKVLKEDIEKTIELKKEDIGEIPEGTMNITENGQYNVSSYASADVQVPGIVPSGELSITSNNTYDVTQYASANVNVPSGLTEIKDASYMFINGARKDIKDTLLSITKKPTTTAFMFGNMYQNYGSTDNVLFDISNIDFSDNKSMQNMFYNNAYGKLSNFRGIQGMNVSKVENMSSCFSELQRYGTSDITEDFTFDLSGWDVSKVTNMTSMFTYFLYNFLSAYTLTIDLHNWDVTNVTYMGGMFNTTKVTNLILTNWNPKNCLNFSNMFLKCDKLTELDLSTWENTANNINTQNMFQYCTRLTRLDVRKFDFSKSSNYSNMFGSTASNGVPNDCLIIVKDDTQKTWITSKFSRLTNVKTVAEL